MKAANILEFCGNKFVSIGFTTKAGEIRYMNGRFNVQKYVKGTGQNHAAKHGYLTFYSLSDKGYRNIKPENISVIRAAGVVIHRRECKPLIGA